MGAAPESTRTDRELVDAVLHKKDETAFRELYRRHTPRLFALVGRLLARGDDEAEDVVQEIWVHAFESLPNFQWGSSFSTWLTGVGWNRVRDRIRRYGRSRESAMEHVPEVPVASAPHEDRVDLERMSARLHGLARMVGVVHDVVGLLRGGLGEHRDIPEGSSR